MKTSPRKPPFCLKTLREGSLGGSPQVFSGKLFTEEPSGSATKLDEEFLSQKSAYSSAQHQGASLCEGVVKQRHRAGRPFFSQVFLPSRLILSLMPFRYVPLCFFLSMCQPRCPTH